LNLLLQRGDHRCPLHELEILLLIGVFEVYNHIGVLIRHLMRWIKLLMNEVPCVLGLAEKVVCDLRLPVLVGRRDYTTTEKVILALQLCELARNGNVALLIGSHTAPLQPCLRGSAVLQGWIWPQGAAATQDLLGSETERV
jgi:hypothetical protein